MSSLLHEVLAVEKSLNTTAANIQATTNKTLQSKETIFTGMVKTNEIFDDSKQHLVAATERKEVQSTVKEQLDFMSSHIGNFWDCILQKEDANQRALADIIIDGEVIASNVPSIVLLGLEKKLKSLVEVYSNIPTLDSAKSWIPAEDYSRPNVFKLQYPTERQQTQTNKTFIEASPATQHHKAQLVEDIKTEVIGKYTIQEFSGNTTSIDKSNKIERLTKLIRAVTTARNRANCVEVNTDLKIGAALFNYIHG